MKFKYFFLIFVLLLVSLVSAGSFGYDISKEKQINVVEKVWNLSVPDYWVNITGDTMTGNLSVSNANVTADYFFGDGSQLTSVNVTDIWVDESGDNMTGSLDVSVSETIGIKEIGYIQDDSLGGDGSYMTNMKAFSMVGNVLYAVSNTDDTLTAFDISDPTDPIELGYLRDDSQGGDATCLDIAISIFVSGKYAYIPSKDDDSLAIFDISDPENMFQVSCIQDDIQGGDADYLLDPINMYLSGNYVYLAGNGDSAFVIYDVSDPTNIVELSYITGMGGITDVFVQGNFAYITSQTEHWLKIVNVTDRENPALINMLLNGTNASALSSAFGVYASGRYVYVASKDSSSISIFDVSDKSAPFEVDYIQDDSQGGDATGIENPRRVIGFGNYLVSAGRTDNKISIFDVSNASNIVEVFVLEDDANNHLDKPETIYFSGRHLFAGTVDDDSVSVMEITGITTPTLSTGTIKTNVISVLENAFFGNDIYVAGGLVVGGSGMFTEDLFGRNINAIEGLVVGISKLFVDSTTGNVGINTATPQNTLNVVGDLNQTSGNTTINMVYGEMWNYTSNASAWIFPIASLGVYYNLTNLTLGNVNGFSFTSATGASGGSYLTVQIAGVYKVDGAFSFESVSNNQLYALTASKNFNTVNSRQCYTRRWITNKAAVGSASVSCLIDLAIGDTINVQVENEASTGDIEIHAINLNLRRIGD